MMEGSIYISRMTAQRELHRIRGILLGPEMLLCYEWTSLAWWNAGFAMRFSAATTKIPNSHSIRFETEQNAMHRVQLRGLPLNRHSKHLQNLHPLPLHTTRTLATRSTRASTKLEPMNAFLLKT